MSLILDLLREWFVLFLYGFIKKPLLLDSEWQKPETVLFCVEKLLLLIVAINYSYAVSLYIWQEDQQNTAT